MITRPVTPQQAAAMMGGGPPKKADESALLLALKKLPRPVSAPHLLHAKGKEVGELVFHVLSSGESGGAGVMAHELVRKELGDDARGTVAYAELYEQKKAYTTLKLACRQPDDTRFPVFFTEDQIRDELTDDEISVLLVAYGNFRRECGPILSEMTDEECEAWIRVLAKGASRFPLSHMSGEALIDLVMYLVKRLTALDSSIATSSSGAPAGEPSETASNEPPTP